MHRFVVRSVFKSTFHHVIAGPPLADDFFELGFVHLWIGQCSSPPSEGCTCAVAYVFLSHSHPTTDLPPTSRHRAWGLQKPHHWQCLGKTSAACWGFLAVIYRLCYRLEVSLRSPGCFCEACALDKQWAQWDEFNTCQAAERMPLILLIL